MADRVERTEAGESVRIAMGQMLVEGGMPAENLARAREMIARAAGEGAQAVVLPECLDLGWTHPSARDLAEPIPGGRSNAICEAAVKNRIHVVAGLTERCGERIYNTAVLASPEGDLRLVYRKINVLTIAQDLYSIGDRMSVVETPLGTIGVNICADNFSNSLELGHARWFPAGFKVVGQGAQRVDRQRMVGGGGAQQAHGVAAGRYPVVTRLVQGEHFEQVGAAVRVEVA